jgi:hypothetical protein
VRAFFLSWRASHRQGGLTNFSRHINQTPPSSKTSRPSHAQYKPSSTAKSANGSVYRISDLFDDSGSVDPVVQIVLDNQYEDFGFAVYRMDYDDEAKWLRWYEQFDKLLDASLEQSAGGEKIMDRLIVYEVEDDELNHLPFRAASE